MSDAPSPTPAPPKYRRILLKLSGEALGTEGGYGLNAANPFGVRDFTRDKSQNGKIEIGAGGTLRFRYRVAIHEGVSPEPLWESFAAVK